MVSSSHAVCSKGLYIAMISTTVETSTPEVEIRPALDLLGDVLEMFVQISTIYEPTDDGTKDNVNISTNLILFYSFSSLRAMMPHLTLKVPVMKYLNYTKELLERN